eukprot:TRINITY_DN19040_c0_g1_i1.p1 TRINITY_DN19040_c0_g1~~TRINITY_DN19040_c0_g1_i1.p1  ORF type:complete len:142 (-),score=15.96 TRINITY_DN19040_c0_g1_i1:668-1093(-)
MRLSGFMDGWLEDKQRGLLTVQEAKWWAYKTRRAYKTRSPLAFLFLDFSKAYDRLEWCFLHAPLAVLGFGPNFCQWAEIPCQQASARIMVNRKVTNDIALGRYVHQGCPLAPLLFTLSGDVLKMVKGNQIIKGIKMDGGGS